MTGPSASGSENGTPTSMHVRPAAVERPQDRRRARRGPGRLPSRRSRGPCVPSRRSVANVVGDPRRHAVLPPRRREAARRAPRAEAPTRLHVLVTAAGEIHQHDGPRPAAPRQPAAACANGVRRLQRRENAFACAPATRTRPAPRRPDVAVLRATLRRAATRAPALRPRSPGPAEIECVGVTLPASSWSTQVRVPCSTPGVPPANRAACRPARIASPPASTPISRTSASSMNASNSPRALLPPPTHASADVGQRAERSEALRPRLVADDRLELAHHQRVRVRPEHRPQQVVRVARRWRPSPAWPR